MDHLLAKRAGRGQSARRSWSEARLLKDQTWSEGLQQPEENWQPSKQNKMKQHELKLKLCDWKLRKCKFPFNILYVYYFTQGEKEMQYK